MIKYGYLLLCSVALAVGNGVINPETPPWSADVLQDGELRLSAELMDGAANVLWIDAREEADYRVAHVPGALLLNESHWEELLPAILDSWKIGQKIIVYCSSRQCQASHAVAERLRSEMVMPDVFVLKGGWEAWRDRTK